MAKKSETASKSKGEQKESSEPKTAPSKPKLVRVRYNGPTARLRVDGQTVEIGGVLALDIDASDRLSGNPDIDVSILEGEY